MTQENVEHPSDQEVSLVTGIPNELFYLPGIQGYLS